MIVVHGSSASGSEREAAEQLERIAIDFDHSLATSAEVVLDIFHSIQCFGQRPQDIDLLVFFADYRHEDKLFVTKSGQRVHSFCAVVEVKGHPPEDVVFDGNACSVIYQGKPHDVTSQNEGQKYSVKSYIEKQGIKAPWLVSLIWLTRVPGEMIPRIDSNIIGSDVGWERFLESVAMLVGPLRNPVATFSSRTWMEKVKAVFGKRLQASKIDRKRLEEITKRVLDRSKQQYAEKLGMQLLLYRGRGGTGKTVRLIRTAHQAYSEQGLRVVLLTYNKALVADLRRLLTLAGVKDGVGRGGIALSTIHSFMYQWLLGLRVIQKGQSDFLEKYEDYKEEALELLRGGALSVSDIESARSERSLHLTWDLVLIDESQDWPANERDFIYQLYGYEKVIIADGVDQLVRGVDQIDWREPVPTKESQVVVLTKSLRLKASLCQTVSHFAECLGYDDWHLEPLPESHGGKVIVLSGKAMSEKFHKRLAATARADGNRAIDILLCVPPSWVKDVIDQSDGKRRKESIVAEDLRSWGCEVWDAVDPEIRDEFPTSLDQYRIVQYESCRGLEGWVVVCFGLDEFFDYKRLNADISEVERSDLYFDEEVAALNYAKRWLMIPLTRAIDTLVIHVSNESSYIGGLLRDLHGKFPEDVQWIDLESE
jgi:hypothetical protein